MAKNEMGYSEFSEHISAAFCDLPSKPNAPTKNISLSTVNKLVIEWSFIPNTQMPAGLITNYIIFMDSNISGDFKEIYVAPNSVKQIEARGLKKGVLYRFKI